MPQNYIDPRLTVVFSKKFDVPIEKFFSKTLREKFDWAIKSVDEDCEWHLHASLRGPGTDTLQGSSDCIHGFKMPTKVDRHKLHRTCGLSVRRLPQTFHTNRLASTRTRIEEREIDGRYLPSYQVRRRTSYPVCVSQRGQKPHVMLSCNARQTLWSETSRNMQTAVCFQRYH